MATPLTRVLSIACRTRVSSCRCFWKTQTAGAAGKSGGSKGAVPKKKPLEVEEDTKKLATRLVGGNFYKEGEDPVLKDDSEYPDWLWKMKLDREPVPLEELSEDDPKYWRRLKTMTMRRRLELKKYKKL